MLLSTSLLLALRSSKKTTFEFSPEETIKFKLNTKDNLLPFGVKFLSQVEIMGSTAIVLGATKTHLWVLSEQNNVQSFDKDTFCKHISNKRLSVVCNDDFLLIPKILATHLKSQFCDEVPLLELFLEPFIYIQKLVKAGIKENQAKIVKAVIEILEAAQKPTLFKSSYTEDSEEFENIINYCLFDMNIQSLEPNNKKRLFAAIADFLLPNKKEYEKNSALLEFDSENLPAALFSLILANDPEGLLNMQNYCYTLILGCKEPTAIFNLEKYASTHQEDQEAFLKNVKSGGLGQLVTFLKSRADSSSVANYALGNLFLLASKARDALKKKNKYKNEAASHLCLAFEQGSKEAIDSLLKNESHFDKNYQVLVTLATHLKEKNPKPYPEIIELLKKASGLQTGNDGYAKIMLAEIYIADSNSNKNRLTGISLLRFIVSSQAPFYQKAGELLENIAKIDGPNQIDALYAIGVIKQSQTDLVSATNYFTSIIKQSQNHKEALARLGRIFYYNTQFNSHKNEGFDYLIKAANVGDEKTIQLLQNIAESSQDKNSVHANYALGLLFYNGIVVKKDFQLAKKYFIQASGMGNAEAKAYYGIIVLQEENDNQLQEKKGLDIVEKAARQGSRIAIDKLKELADPIKGKQSSAQFTLGRVYFSGLGVKRDFRQAAYYLFDLYFKTAPNAQSSTLLVQFSHPEIRKHLDSETIAKFVGDLGRSLTSETVEAIFEEARVAKNLKVIFTLINTRCRQYINYDIVLTEISDPEFYQNLDDESVAELFISVGNSDKLSSLSSHQAWAILKTKLQKSLEDPAIAAKTLSCISLVRYLEENEKNSKNLLHDRIQQHLKNPDFFEALKKYGVLTPLLQSDLALVKILKSNEDLTSKAKTIFVKAAKAEIFEALKKICDYLQETKQNNSPKYQILSVALNAIQTIENIQKLEQFTNALANDIQKKNNWANGLFKKRDFIDDLMDGLKRVQKNFQQQNYTDYLIQPSNPLNYFEIQLPSMEIKSSSANSQNSSINRNSISAEDKKRPFLLESYFENNISEFEKNKCILENVLILGGKCSGKTKLLQRYINGSYSEPERYNDCEFSTFKIADNPKKLKIMDLHEIIRDYHYNFDPDRNISFASLIILTIDLSHETPLENFDHWMNKIAISGKKNIIVVVGTKADLVQQRTITKENILEKIKNYKSKVPIYDYIEVSSKNNTGPIKELFIEPFLFMDYRARLLAYLEEERKQCLLRGEPTTELDQPKIQAEEAHSLSELVSIVKDLRKKLTPETFSSLFPSLPPCLVNLNKQFGENGELLPKPDTSEKSLTPSFTKKPF